MKQILYITAAVLSFELGASFPLFAQTTAPQSTYLQQRGNQAGQQGNQQGQSGLSNSQIPPEVNVTLKTFLDAIDKGQYANSWSLLDSQLQQLLSSVNMSQGGKPSQAWVTLLDCLRKPLGQATRQLVGARPITQQEQQKLNLLSNSSNSQLSVIEYKTTFENPQALAVLSVLSSDFKNKSATGEKIILKGGKVLGYEITSTDSNQNPNQLR